MYRILFLIFLSSCFSYTAKSQPNYRLIATLHPGDCTSCLNMLGRFTQLVPEVEKSIIFERKLQVDSAILVRDYFLEDFEGEIVFSDSLFKRYHYKDGIIMSSVSLLNKKNDEFISIPITALADTTIDFKHYLKERDTIPLSQLESIGYAFLYYTNDKYYCIDQSKMKLWAFNRLNNSLAYEFSVDDAIIKRGYAAKFGKNALDNYKKAEDHIKATRFIGGRTRLRSWQVYNDSVMLLLAQPELIYNKYPHPGEGDSIISDFFTLLTLYKGKTIAVQNIENYMTGIYIDTPGIRRNNKDRYDAFWVHDAFFFHNNKLYMEVGSGYIEMIGKNWVLAEFTLSKSKKWVYNRMVAELPKFYTDTSTLVGYNSIFNGYSIMNHRGYCAFSLGDKLISIIDSSLDIPLTFLPARLSGSDTYSYDFLLQGDWLYFNTYQGKGHSIYYKYNLVNKKLEHKKDSFIDSSFFRQNVYFMIDPFDPSYVFSQLDKQRLIRYKVFSD